MYICIDVYQRDYDGGVYLGVSLRGSFPKASPQAGHGRMYTFEMRIGT